MSVSNRPSLKTALVLVLLAFGLAGCATQGPVSQPEPEVMPTLPPAFPPQDIVGRWGLAAYHRDEDKARTEAAAANQCKQPYIITLGSTGGVMMHLPDQSTATELRLKGAPNRKTYVGPEGDPPGSQQDREVISFDGRILILRYMDSEVQGRYGTMVYVRCGPEGGKPVRPKGKTAAGPKPKPKAAAKPAAATPPAAAAPAPVQPPIQQAPPAR